MLGFPEEAIDGALQKTFARERAGRVSHALDQDLLERVRDAAFSLPSEGLLQEAVDRLLGESEHLGES